MGYMHAAVRSAAQHAATWLMGLVPFYRAFTLRSSYNVYNIIAISTLKLRLAHGLVLRGPG